MRANTVTRLCDEPDISSLSATTTLSAGTRLDPVISDYYCGCYLKFKWSGTSSDVIFVLYMNSSYVLSITMGVIGGLIMFLWWTITINQLKY